MEDPNIPPIILEFYEVRAGDDLERVHSILADQTSDLTAPIELFQPDALFRVAHTHVRLRSRAAQLKKADDK